MIKYFKKKWNFFYNEFKARENHWIQARLIGKFWYDETLPLTKKNTENPRLRNIIYIDQTIIKNGLNHSSHRLAENVMKHNKNIILSFIEYFIGTKTIEKNGIQTLIDSENINKNTLSMVECKYLKEYVVLHFLRSKQMLNLALKIRTKFFGNKFAILLYNIEMLFGYKRRLNNLSSYNTFILNISNAQFFLSENTVIRLEDYECGLLKEYCYKHLNRFLYLLMKENLHNSSIIKTDDPFNIIPELTALCPYIKKTAENPESLFLTLDESCDKHINIIINKISNYFKNSIFFIYHPTRYLLITNHSTIPNNEKTAFQFLANFICEYMIDLNTQYFVVKDKQQELFLRTWLKNKNNNQIINTINYI